MLNYRRFSLNDRNSFDMFVVKQYTAADVEIWRHFGILTAAGLARVAE